MHIPVDGGIGQSLACGRRRARLRAEVRGAHLERPAHRRRALAVGRARRAERLGPRVAAVGDREIAVHRHVERRSACRRRSWSSCRRRSPPRRGPTASLRGGFASPHRNAIVPSSCNEDRAPRARREAAAPCGARSAICVAIAGRPRSRSSRSCASRRRTSPRRRCAPRDRSRHGTAPLAHGARRRRRAGRHRRRPRPVQLPAGLPRRARLAGRRLRSARRALRAHPAPELQLLRSGADRPAAHAPDQRRRAGAHLRRHRRRAARRVAGDARRLRGRCCFAINPRARRSSALVDDRCRSSGCCGASCGAWGRCSARVQMALGRLNTCCRRTCRGCAWCARSPARSARRRATARSTTSCATTTSASIDAIANNFPFVNFFANLGTLAVVGFGGLQMFRAAPDASAS